LGYAAYGPRRFSVQSAECTPERVEDMHFEASQRRIRKILERDSVCEFGKLLDLGLAGHDAVSVQRARHNRLGTR
jgi:hypothetical protein